MFTGCLSSQFPCDNGECVDLSQQCTGIPECEDYSDEKECSESNNHFLLTDFRLTQAVLPDCEQEGLGECTTPGYCYALIAWCDGNADCPDGTDENNCTPRECTHEL